LLVFVLSTNITFLFFNGLSLLLIHNVSEKDDIPGRSDETSETPGRAQDALCKAGPQNPDHFWVSFKKETTFPVAKRHL
jgi:hypothetical protein